MPTNDENSLLSVFVRVPRDGQHLDQKTEWREPLNMGSTVHWTGDLDGMEKWEEQ